MKKRFTRILAALALLVGLTIPMGMRGQTRTNQTAFYGFETGDAGWTATTFVTNNTAITAHGGSKYGATDGTTASVQYNDIVASPQSLTCYYSKTTTNTNAGSKFHIQVSSNNSTWTTVESGLGMDQVTKGTWYELTADLSSYSNVYVRVRYDGTTGVRALDDITLIYDDGNTPSTDPEITFTPASITVDEVLVGNEVSTTFSVAQANLTSDITLSVDNGSLSPSSIAQGAAATNVTWTYTPTTAGAISATVTATSGTTTETLAISGTAIAPVEGYDVDFEYATDMYPNWTFDNMTTYQTGSITAHGGAYYGTTGGKATASITTTSTVANPGTLTCYVSKQSGNTTSSTWYIQVSENGSTWTEVESHSATSMSQGSWVEFTADLTDYTDVYVRVYYSGSTAIRNIDDLTLTTVEPSSDPSITAADVNIAYDAEEGTINYTINNPVEGGSLVASCDAEWIEVDDTPQTSSTGSIDFICYPNSNFYAHSATVTLTYTYSDSKATVTKDITVTQALDPDANGSTAELPINVSEAIEAIDEVGTVSNIYVGGIVSEITASTSNYITFKMYDEDGNDYYLQAYHCTGNNISEVAVGDQVVVYGTLEKYGTSVYQFASGCQLVSLTHPASITVEPAMVEAPAAGANGTLYVTYNIDSEAGVEIHWFDAAGERLLNGYEWMSAQLDANWNISYTIQPNTGEARTAYMKIYGMDADANDVYSNLVTFNQAAYVSVTTYTLTTTIESGRHYIITNNSNKAMGAQSTNNRSAVDISIDNGVATVTGNDVYEFVINGPDSIGSYIIYDVAGSGYLYAAGTGSSNYLKKETFNNDGANRGFWEIEFSGDAAVITSKTTATDRKIMRYNSSSTCFSCYASGQQPIYLYMKDETTPQYDFYKDIANYTTPVENQPANGWNLIASPVASVTPSAENGMLANTYDLYYFDQTGGNNGMEWKNYKANNFPLVSGQGYLYANSNNVTLKFTGTPNTSGEVSLTYSTANTDENMRGWNLVGNPFGQVAYISGHDFYRMNDARTEIVVSTTTSVNPMEGIFVKAADAEDNSITFSTTAPEGAASNESQNVVLNVVRNRGTVIDRAIVSFNDGAQLPKLTINENSSKLYITQDNKDYAVVRSEAQGEMPVNFKAAENGTYTLTVNPEGVEMNYLHLIDNMTGMDVDLLQTPSYSFNATIRDYESRFRLVFAANNEDGPSTGSGTFAFYSNGNWIINNAGEATLQVIDLTGRILSSETVNGSVSTTINAVPGVYMLRLINGENVNVQKIVVR